MFKTEPLCSELGATNAVLDQASGILRIVGFAGNFQIGLFQVENGIAELSDGSLYTGPNVVEFIAGLRLQGQHVGTSNIIDIDKVVGLRTIAIDDGRSANVNLVEHYGDDPRVNSMLILSRAINIHIAKANIVETMPIVKGAAHSLTGDLGGTVKVPVVERMRFGHWHLSRIAINGGGGGVNETLDIAFNARLKDIKCPLNVHVESSAWVVAAMQ